MICCEDIDSDEVKVEGGYFDFLFWDVILVGLDDDLIFGC